MTNIWKKILALCLSALLILSCFSACAGQGGESETTTTPSQTEPIEEVTTLKVLTLGHSLAVDAGHMLALIAATEGYKDMEVGTLYYSGCPLYRHVEFLQSDSREYDLYVSSTTTPNETPKIMNGVTMKEALRYDYWDIIIMQGGPFEIAVKENYTNGNIQTIQNYVNEHKLNPNATFAWNMFWATPVDDELRATYPKPEDNFYVKNYEKYEHSRTKLFDATAQCTADYIDSDDSFTCLIPSGTAIENALSSYLTEKDLHRDYAHASDLGRVIASYTWFCALTGVEQLDEIKLDAIPKNFFKSTVGTEDRVLTDAEKAIILESVNNALKAPLQMTQSQYTQAPSGNAE